MFYIEKVALKISCRNLQSQGTLNQRNIQVRVSIQKHLKAEAFSDETECIQNDSNPNFQKLLAIDFFFDVNQQITLDVLNNGQIIGSTETTASAIIGANQQTLILDLQDQPGQIIIRAEKAKTESKIISWEWSGKIFRKSGCFGWGRKTNSHLSFFQKVDGEYTYAAGSDYIFKSQNPSWKAFQMLDKNLCFDDNQDFKVECSDLSWKGKEKLIGGFETNLEKIKSGVREFDLYKKKSKTGSVSVSNFRLEPHFPFMDYLLGGTKLKIIVGIDFSASNDQQQHHQSKDSPNSYYKAMNTLLPFVLNYDADPLVYGFGAEDECQVPRGVNDCFPIETTEKDTEGILKAYEKTLDEMTLSGPTKLVPLIKHVNEKCEEIKETERDEYVILLIFTNGQVADATEAKEEIEKASDLPLSIRFIGIGDGDFPELERLQWARTAETRELVQFVPFSKYRNDINKFSQMALFAIPSEFVKYMDLVGKKPVQDVVGKSQFLDYE